jgi:spore germination protein YaaH
MSVPSVPQFRSLPISVTLLAVLLVLGRETSTGATSAFERRVPVLCYVESLFADATLADIDLRPCTHVIDAFVLVDRSGALRPANGLPRKELIAAARRAGARPLVAVGGSTVPGETFSVIGREKHRLERFLRELSEFVVRSGYEGVDLDWEFPTPLESHVHLTLTRAIRSALNNTGAFRSQRAVVTVPVAAYWLPSYDFTALAEVVDYIILMGYDFHNPALGPWSNAGTELWPVDSASPIESSIRGAAREIIRRGFVTDRLVIALPMYTGANQPWEKIRDRALSASSPLHGEYLEKNIDGVWVTDPEALEHKIGAVLTRRDIAGNNAAGIGLWQLGHQGRHRDLTDAVLRSLRGAPLHRQP